MSTSPTATTQVSTTLLVRLRQVLLLNTNPNAWYIQRRYQPGARNVWTPIARPMADHDLSAMVLHRHWLACRAPSDGLTDRLAFDLDCKTAGDRTRQHALYWSLRHLMGAHRSPLVFRTPSVYGLRVVYRVPTTPLAQLNTSVNTGLVADVCRGAGLPVRPGQLELFPQRAQIDRLPLGRGMPLVDPDTLETLPHASIEDRFDAVLLEGALLELERWYGRVYDDLVAHLRERPTQRAVPGLLPRLESHDDSRARTTSGRGMPRQVNAHATTPVSAEVRQLITAGITTPSTRYWAEFQVGLAVLAEPSLVGIAGPLTDARVAEAIADWLAARHNGCSYEWHESVRRCGSAERARAWWVERYLQRDPSTRLHMIDRLERAIGAVAPDLRRTHLVSPAERDTLMAVAADAYPPSTRRYRAECWLVAWQRATRSIIAYHARRQTPLALAISSGTPTLELEVCSRWLRAWPFGEGRDSLSGAPRYVEYRNLLAAAGLMQLVRPAPVPARLAKGASRGRELPHEAHRYRIAQPNLMVRVRDVGIDHAQLAALRNQLPRQYDRAPSVDEIHHALTLTRWGVDLRARYGRRTEQWVSALAGAPGVPGTRLQRVA